MYKQLAAWHQTFGADIELLLYPSDEFGGQELPSDKIPAFVESKGLPTNGGGCILMAKTRVNGPDADPVWRYAKSVFPGNVGWNFGALFVFDKGGQPLGRFSARELGKVERVLKDAL